jgi:NO-binding membrane sensor protein with MHYT domain
MHSHGTHDPVLVALSVLIAVLGSWTALDLLRRVRANAGTARRWWLAGAAAATGASIWSMHFVAMLAYELGVEVRYDVGQTVLSLLLAVAATAVGFAAVSAPAAAPGPARIGAAGLAMGLGICLMHYVGMAAMRLPAIPADDPVLVAASGAVAVGASTLAIVLALGDRPGPARAAGAVALGLAISGMHYTAMAAVSFRPLAHAGHDDPSGVPALALAIGIAACTLLLLSLALVAASFDRRLELPWRRARRRRCAAAGSGCAPSSTRCRSVSSSPTPPPARSSSQTRRWSGSSGTSWATRPTGAPTRTASTHSTPMAGPWPPMNTRWRAPSSAGRGSTASHCSTGVGTTRSCTSR